MRAANNDRWHFTVQTSSQGNSYVYAYQTKWDPISKTSRCCSKRYVGRLSNDGLVNISDKFEKDFPAKGIRIQLRIMPETTLAAPV